MAGHFDFDDGSVPCGECGRTVPVEEARPLLRLHFKQNVDFVGQTEYGERQFVACPRCYRRLMWVQRFRNLKERAGLILAVVFAVVGSIVILYVVLAWLGVVGK
jgi:endogenous inhibitor of DNA gyrase (YacG/DUF329 family)